MNKNRKVNVYEVSFRRLFGEKRWVEAQDFTEAIEKVNRLMKADKELRTDEIASIDFQGTIDA